MAPRGPTHQRKPAVPFFDEEGRRLCDGRLVTFFADESSWRCTVCDWSGWPRQTVDGKTGYILSQEPHRWTYYRWLHGSQTKR
jgi:hypothetical protein